MKKWCRFIVVCEENKDGSITFSCRLAYHIKSVADMISFTGCPVFLERL